MDRTLIVLAIVVVVAFIPGMAVLWRDYRRVRDKNYGHYPENDPPC